MLLGHATAAIAEEDALHPAGDQYPIADHKQTVRRRRRAGQERLAISRDGPVLALVVPTNEELMIARDTARLVAAR